jgi:molybdopterin/thiamine biosynthesis adenylyltransferase
MAHSEGHVKYLDSGDVELREPWLEARAQGAPRVIPPHRQFPCVLATFLDLSKALSSTANSPLMASGKSLRDEFDAEFDKYRKLCSVAAERRQWEPDYGSYLFDPTTESLFLLAPEFWHRVALQTSAGALLQPEARQPWFNVRERLSSTVVGVIGASVGSNVIEAINRELRPKHLKIADPDWVELTNLNRLERVNVSQLAASRARRSELRNAFEMHRHNKAEVAAYQQHMVDPYANIAVYTEGITEQNLDEFLLGNDMEPRLNFVVEEADDVELKVTVRRRCRELGIPVLMVSDFGHIVTLHFQDFLANPNLPIAFGCDDEECERLLVKCVTSGNRNDLFAFVRAFVGADCFRDEFADWMAGAGEQPTSSLPQSGATALISGAIAAKAVAQHVLGYPIEARGIWNFSRRSTSPGAS